MCNIRVFAVSIPFLCYDIRYIFFYNKSRRGRNKQKNNGRNNWVFFPPFESLKQDFHEINRFLSPESHLLSIATIISLLSAADRPPSEEKPRSSNSQHYTFVRVLCCPLLPSCHPPSCVIAVSCYDMPWMIYRGRINPLSNDHGWRKPQERWYCRGCCILIEKKTKNKVACRKSKQLHQKATLN